MNDAGGERVDDHVRAADGDDGANEPPEHQQHWKQHQHDQHPHDHSHHEVASRWWFAASAFPMIAGTLGPVASAFSILALVRPWRQYYPSGSDLDDATYVTDPVWLTAVNAVQLVIALCSNATLLLNMTRRLRFSIAQPITIVGWYISSICLVALTATAAGPLVLQPEMDYIWSQGFYYGIYSAVLYFVVASLMVATFAGAQAGHYPKDFMLTASQRTLMLQTIMFLLYLLLGALVFCKIEEWHYLDAVYWAAVTLFTVGFGDMYPNTTLGQGLLIPYSLVGIISLGLVIGSIRSLMLERARRRFDARVVERKRRQTLRRMVKKGKHEILVPISDEQQPPPDLSSSASATSTGLTEFERREAEFKLMRKIQNVAARRERWYAMGISTTTWLVLWVVGAEIFRQCEEPYQGWSYFQGFYFAFLGLTTIGYGDLTPVSNGGKSFWVFWAFLALPTMTVLISNAGDTVVKVIRDGTDQIATITILPGERGFKKDFKRILGELSWGKLFQEDEEVGEKPAGLLGDTSGAAEDDNESDVEGALQQDQRDLVAEGAASDEASEKRSRDAHDDGVHAKRVDANTAAGNRPQSSAHTSRQTAGGVSGNVSGDASRAASDTSEVAGNAKFRKHPHLSKHTNRSISFTNDPHPNQKKGSKNDKALPKFTRTASLPRQTLPDIPSNPVDYHIILVEEIGRVMQHLKSKPPRKYTFAEWAWYLRLVGEDEGDAERHRGPGHIHRTLHKKRPPEERGKDGEGKAGENSWSWVGTKSPLMGSMEEAEWILERLTRRLTEELRGLRRKSKAGEEETKIPID